MGAAPAGTWLLSTAYRICAVDMPVSLTVPTLLGMSGLTQERRKHFGQVDTGTSAVWKCHAPAAGDELRMATQSNVSLEEEGRMVKESLQVITAVLPTP